MTRQTPPPRLLPRVHRTATGTSPAATGAVGHTPSGWLSFAARDPACPRAASDAPRWPRGRHSLSSRPKTHARKHWGLVFFDTRADPAAPSWGPRKLGACGGTQIGARCCIQAEKSRFFDFHFASADTGGDWPVPAPFPGDSRGCLCSRGRPDADSGHRAFEGPGTRLQTRSRCDAATFGAAARSPTDLFELCGAGISAVPTGCACTMWREITAAAATHTTNPS